MKVWTAQQICITLSANYSWKHGVRAANSSAANLNSRSSGSRAKISVSQCLLPNENASGLLLQLLPIHFITRTSSCS